MKLEKRWERRTQRHWHCRELEGEKMCPGVEFAKVNAQYERATRAAEPVGRVQVERSTRRKSQEVAQQWRKADLWAAGQQLRAQSYTYLLRSEVHCNKWG